MNLYAPVEQQDAGIQANFRPLQDAVTAIMQRRAQMKIHADNLAAQKAQQEKTNALGWAQLAETQKYHRDETTNMQAERSRDLAKLAAENAQRGALEADKAKAAETQGFQTLRQDVQGPGGDSINSPQAQALRAQLTAGGIHATQRQMMTSPMMSDPGVVGAPAGASSPLSPGGLSMQPMTLPETGHEVVDYEGPKTGASFTHDPVAEIQRRRAAGNAAASQLQNEAGSVGGTVGDLVGKAAPDVVRSEIMAGTPADKAITRSLVLPMEQAKLTEAAKRAERSAINISVGKGDTEHRLNEKELRQSIEASTKEDGVAKLKEKYRSLGETYHTVSQNRNGELDEAGIRSMAKAYNSGALTDRDVAALDPTNKLGLFERIKGVASGVATGVRMDEATRAAFLAAVDALHTEASSSAKEAYLKFKASYKDDPDYKDEFKNLLKSQETAHFGGFDWFKPEATGDWAPPRKGGKKGSSRKSVSVSGGGGVHPDAAAAKSFLESLK